MNSAEPIEDIPDLTNKNGPGERLQSARIEQGLTIDDVANRMHLSKAILESIEENDFDEITAPIFVKGYLRAYARIVSLDEEELIKLYMEFYSNEDPPISSISNTAREISTDDARIKWMTYLVVIVLLTLLAIWWWNKGQNQNETVSLDVQQPTVVEESHIDEATDSEVDLTEVVVAIEAESEQALGEASESISVTSGDLGTEDPGIEDLNESAEADTDGMAEESIDDSIEMETSVSSEADIAETEGVEPESSDSVSDEVISDNAATAIETESENWLRRQAPTGNDKVILVIHADTWADIKDINKHKLIYDLLRAGQSFELTGQAPFSIFFGNGHGVEVVYNGDQVDILSLTRDDNTARLKIGN
jgi:cytoskeleton protein RodZ